jgi:hypothetical protein
LARLRIPDLKAGYYQNIAAHFYKTALSVLRLKRYLCGHLEDLPSARRLILKTRLKCLSFYVHLCGQ